MSFNKSALLSQNPTNTKENPIHITCLEYLKNFTNYTLFISFNQKNDQDSPYFSKPIYSAKNDIFILNNLSSNEIIEKIYEKSVNRKIKSLFSYIDQSIFDRSMTKFEQTAENQFQTDSDKKSSFKNIDSLLNNKDINILLKYDLNEKNNPLTFDKNSLYNKLSFKININHVSDKSLEKSILFILDIKKIIKSIQVKLESLKESRLADSNSVKEFFIPLLEYKNIGFIISPNLESGNLDLNMMKTNFNSIVKQKFILNGIVFAIDIFSLWKITNTNNENLNNTSLKKIENIKEINEKNYDYYNDETTSESSNYNSPKITNKQFYERIIDNNLNDSLCNHFILNNKNNNYLKFNKKINNNKFIINNNNSFSNINGNSKYQYQNLKLNTKTKYNNNKKNKQCKYIYENNKINLYYNNNGGIIDKYSYYDNDFEINTIILNSNDIFSKTLFNRYQDKSNSICNLKILIEFLKIQMKKPLSKLTIFDYFSSFIKLSSLSLTIPFYKNDGVLTKNTFTPSLHELKIYIQNPKIINKLKRRCKPKDIRKKNSSSSLLSSSTEDNKIFKEIDGLEISIIENKNIAKIYYNETRPYYLTESLCDKLKQLMTKLKFIQKINIDKNILYEKSYISIEWNIVNGNNISGSSFISYHLFNGNLLGVLSKIKEKEKSFWTNSIEEIHNKRIKVDYNYLIEENYYKIFDFINNDNIN